MSQLRFQIIVKGSAIMAKTNSENVCNFVKNRKTNLISLFHGKCCICGFDKFQEALEFHHVNPEEKELSLSSNIMVSLDKQIKEARKCILVCSNCHKGIHAKYYEVPDNWKDLFDEKQAQYLLEQNEEIKKGKKHYCKRCGKLLNNNTTYCVECGQIVQRVVERPTREELKNLIRTKPFTQIGKVYGVTDNSIRKWCKLENLPTKKSDINFFTDQEWEKI